MTVKEMESRGGQRVCSLTSQATRRFGCKTGGGCDQTSLRAALVKAKDHAQRIGYPRNIG
jgi:hypothetical protein